MVSSLSGQMAIVHCEDCGIHTHVWFCGIAAEMLPGEARELLEELFHGVREFHFVKLNPTWGVKAARCTGRLKIYLPIKIWLNADPYRDGPFGGYGARVRRKSADV